MASRGRRDAARAPVVERVDAVLGDRDAIVESTRRRRAEGPIVENTRRRRVAGVARGNRRRRETLTLEPTQAPATASRS